MVTNHIGQLGHHFKMLSTKMNMLLGRMIVAIENATATHQSLAIIH